ncbi:MAG: hypothetical protein J6R82_02465 [Clostridia bacterium]|nr:hypothetical protein [Clostridia bacterium]
MKKVFGIFIAVLCICFVLAMPVSAAQDPMAVEFQNALGLLDHFYHYNYDYMIRIASDEFISWEGDDWWKPVTVSAKDFDEVLHKYFVITDKQIEELREYGNRDHNVEIYDENTGDFIKEIPFFDAEAQTYTFQYLGGFGGTMPPRSYLGYVKKGETYEVFYQNITYAYLSDYLPEDENEWDYAENLGWPEFIEMGGLRFENGPDGYYTLLSYDDYGRKYTVEMNGDVVRLISCTEYTKADLPDAFDDKTEVIYDLPQNGDVTIPENECFTPGTVVKVEKLDDGAIFNVAVQSMEKVAEKFQVFEFTAQMDGAAVQPDGTMAVTFAIPEGYSKDVAVYYMAPDGKLELVPFTVDALAGTVTAQLSHFSTYIIVDNESKPHEHAYTAVVTPPTCTAEGYTTHTCDCGDSYVDSKTPVAKHSFGEWVETKAPTEELEGEEKRDCANCDHFETRPVSKLEPAPETENDPPSKPAPDTDADAESGTDAESDTDTESDETPDEGLPMGLIIGIAAAVVVLAGVIVAILLAKKKK